MTGLTTSELARQGGINLESVRFYEKQGLLPKPPRTGLGYRVFQPESVRRVRFIKRAQELGFSLREIKELLALRSDSSCADVRERADAKMNDIEQKIRDLQRMKKSLSRLLGKCPGRGPSSACPIMDCLEAEFRKA